CCCTVLWMCWVVFFFSSRRRHTRFDCDWSSDVCSSDLHHTAGRSEWAQTVFGLRRLAGGVVRIDGNVVQPASPGQMARQGVAYRSEERRVGKEWRSRWAQDHEKKKKKRRTQQDSPDVVR